MPDLTAPVDPRPLALARIGIGAVAALNALEGHHVLVATSEGRLALPQWDVLPAVTQPAATAYLLVLLTAGICLSVGFLTQAAAGVVPLVTWFGFVWEQQTYSNHATLTSLLAIWLLFTRSGACWSLDARLRGERVVVTLGGQLPVMTQLSVCYLFAAVAKLNEHFLSGETLRAFTWLPLHDAAFAVIAAGTICGELLLAVGLWIPRVRRFALTTGVMLHLGILTAMPTNWYSLGSFSLLCLSQYWMFAALPRHSEAASTVARTRVSVA